MDLGDLPTLQYIPSPSTFLPQKHLPLPGLSVDPSEGGLLILSPAPKLTSIWFRVSPLEFGVLGR